MGVSPSAEIFQRIVSSMLICTKPIAPNFFIDDALDASEHDFEEYLVRLDEIMKRLKDCGPKAKIIKSAMCQKGVECLDL